MRNRRPDGLAPFIQTVGRTPPTNEVSALLEVQIHPRRMAGESPGDRGTMKYYSYSESLGSRYRKPVRSRSPIVPRESVPTTINMLDVLLSIWIAEATLEIEPGDALRSARRTARKRAADVERRAGWEQPELP